jgi:hypothetical protein
MASSGAGNSSSGSGHTDAGVDSGSADTGSAGGDTGAADTGSGANTVTGMLGTTPLNPIMSAYWINNAFPPETIVYLIAGNVSCSQLGTNGWLAAIPAGIQVVELVMPSSTTTGMVSIPSGEANYAFGGMSSTTETSASSGSINITKNDPMGTIEGTVSATYATGGSIMGSFHADSCPGGMGY